jgi:DNA-binding helix-hairpin-helix protein with protein kinase domain
VYLLSFVLQADVFSFGILMYMVLTGGQHPFEELLFQSERDKAFADVSTSSNNVIVFSSKLKAGCGG